MKRNKWLHWAFLLLFPILGYAGQSDFSAPESKQASLRVELNGQGTAGCNCSGLLQNCVVNVTESTGTCVLMPGSVSITNTSTIVARNISASSVDANFTNYVIQNNGCPADLAPGASCTISFFTNAPVTFTLANVLVRGANTNATYFDMNAFICALQPQIANVFPASGPAAGGQVVTIIGTNFNASATVTVGGNAAVVNSATTNQIVVTTPPGTPGVANVVVTVSGNASNAFPYTYVTAPMIASVFPTAGPVVGNQTVTITGTNFIVGATTVSFGGTPGSNVTVSSSTQLVVTSPPHAAGIVNVTVSTAGGTSNALAYNYDANAPVIITVSPSSGSAAGGDDVTITGANFSAGFNTVLFGGNAAVIGTENPTTITVTTPPGSVGSASVVVITSGVTSNTQSYTYN